jgi:hypothetical protein
MAKIPLPRVLRTVRPVPNFHSRLHKLEGLVLRVPSQALRHRLLILLYPIAAASRRIIFFTAYSDHHVLRFSVVPR